MIKNNAIIILALFTLAVYAHAEDLPQNKTKQEAGSDTEENKLQAIEDRVRGFQDQRLKDKEAKNNTFYQTAKAVADLQGD